MKFSLTTHFSRLAFMTLVAVFLLIVGGRLMVLGGGADACPGWPLCLPAGLPGWIQVLHRISAGIASLLVVALFVQAWRTQRNDLVLLPLASAVLILYFAQVVIGALAVSPGSPVYLAVLHSLTAAALWAALAGLVFLSGCRTSSDPVTPSPLNIRQRARDFLALTKPIIVSLLLATTFAGMVAGGKAWPSTTLLFWTLLGGALAAGGSSAINQFIDRDLDRNMQRTAQRPLASRRMTPAEGLAFGLILCLASFYIMAGFVNLLAAWLTLAGMVYYVLLYSILLKRATVQNIVIGGGAGAIPPVVGWVAATGSLDIPALFLFAIVFFWTPPHFWALALVRRKDYERAGVPMLPVVRGERATRGQIMIYTLELVGLTLLMPLLNIAGSFFLVSALVLGGALIYAAWQVWRQEGNRVAWRMYRYSSMYLFFLFAALAVDAII
jgi:heme o synthase